MKFIFGNTQKMKLHKTFSNFTEYREIFPEINKNFFIIGIKSSKGGAYLLINNKYEI